MFVASSIRVDAPNQRGKAQPNSGSLPLKDPQPNNNNENTSKSICQQKSSKVLTTETPPGENWQSVPTTCHTKAFSRWLRCEGAQDSTLKSLKYLKHPPVDRDWIPIPLPSYSVEDVVLLQEERQTAKWRQHCQSVSLLP